MNRGIDTRLRKLETLRGARDAQLFVVEGKTAADRDAQINELIRSGEARASDSFIHTGVTRSQGSPFRHGSVADLMDRVAAQGRKLHEPHN